jgi:hypothetical protein
MAVGAQQDLDPRPEGPDGADEAAQEGADLTPTRPLARAQQRGHEPPLAVKDDDRLEAVIVVVGVEQAKLLVAMDAVEGVVDVEHDALRHLPERGAILVDQRPPEAQQRADVGQVFQPRDRRLRAQFFARWQAVERQFEHRVAAQCVGIVAVFVTGGDHQHAEADDLGQAVLNLLRCARIVEAGGQAIGHTQPPLDLAQRQQAAFRGQPAAVEAGDHGLAPNR